MNRPPMRPDDYLFHQGDERSAGATVDGPTMTCPRCGAEEPDFDGFGMLAHTKPAYPNGCGYCSHPTRDIADGVSVCGICGHEVMSP